MFIKVLYNYFKLFYSLSYIYYYDINILNNEKWINNLKINIENCGCIAIKFIQIFLPKLSIIHPNTKLIEEFNIFYEHCNKHTLETTYKIYKKDLNIDLNINFKIIKLLGSGSIGQVYLVENIYNNKKYALKINHPNLQYEYIIFYYFLNIIIYFIDYKKFFPVHNINDFLLRLKNQINLLNEAKYNNIFHNLYDKYKKYVIIPDIIFASKNILLMDYIEGNIYNENNNNNTQYDKYKILTLLSLFVHNSCLNNISHGDLHKGNWRFLNAENNLYKIIIYDFGFCFNIDKNEYCIIEDLLTHQNKKLVINNFIKYYINLEYNKNIKYDMIKNDINKFYDFLLKDCDYKRIKLEQLINGVLNLCINHNIQLSDNCLNGMLIFLQLSGYFDEVKSLTSECTYEKFTKNLLAQAKTYNICHDLLNFLEKKIEINNTESEFSLYNKDLDILKDLCINKENFKKVN